ncbi:MAG: FkbM family methyltransferase [Xanthobacteraceae bacterium]|jgi:FkbM family methyltransferase
MRAIFPHHVENELKVAFFGRSTHGFFVDVGANDPQLASQTWHLEQLGWDGVLIEPQPDLAEELRKYRRTKVYAVACSSPANAGKALPLHVAGSPHMTGIHASFDPNFAVPDMRRMGVIEVPVKTLDEILIDVKAPVPIDFVSIDVETHEIEVLEGFDISKWRPRLMLIEDLALDLRLHRYITRRGYKWIRRTGLNGWYVPADSPMPVSLFGRFQFLRKHYLATPFRRLREHSRRWRKKI